MVQDVINIKLNILRLSNITHVAYRYKSQISIIYSIVLCIVLLCRLFASHFF